MRLSGNTMTGASLRTVEKAVQAAFAQGIVIVVIMIDVCNKDVREHFELSTK